MIKYYFLLFVVVNLSMTIKAQVPNLTGIWESDSGKTIQIESNNMGFRYKDVSQANIIQVGYLGINFGVPTFRANFGNSSFSLYMVKSDDTILTSNSSDPNKLYTWTKQSEDNDNQNPLEDNQSRQYKQAQQQTANLVPGASFISKKYFLEQQKKMAESRLKTAEQNFKVATPAFQTNYQFQIDRLTNEINSIDLKIMDLEQMKQRGEIQ